MNTQLLRISSLWAGAGSRLRIAFLLLPYIAWMIPVASGQTNTTVNLGTQARNPDFSSMPVTRPVSVGASLPSTCVVGQLFFNSSATAGNNLYACTSTNTWNSQGSSLTLPLSVANGGSGSSTPGLVAGSNVTITGNWPNQTINGTGSSVSVGSSLPSNCTIGQLFFNSAAASGSNLYGCTTANNWTVIGGATLTSPLPVANGGTGTATPSLVAGSNVAVTGSWPNQTVADTAISVGTSAPSTCTIGQLFFNKSAAAGSNLYGCTATNTFTVVGGATLTSPLPVANGGTGTATPSLVAGSNVSIAGAWPNQTISASSTGGTAGNATSIQGAGVSANTPIDSQTLVYSSSAAAYMPTSIYTLQNGMGTSTSGTSNLQVNISMGMRAVTATTDAVLSTDCGGLVTYNNASAVAVALPQAGLAGNFAAGCPVTVRNYGVGALTITPSSGTIGGVSSQVVNQGKACLMVSDGTNWQLGSCN